MRRLLAIAAVCATGCYRPSAAERCTVTCGGNGAAPCPDGLACFDGLCKTSSTDTCGVSPSDGPAPIDSLDSSKVPSDGPTPDGCETFGTGLFKYSYCLGALPGPISMPTAFDTSTDCVGVGYAHVTVAGADVCVVIASQITVPNGLTATGSLPLVLVADDVELSLTIISSAGAGFGCTNPGQGAGGGGGAGGTAGSKGGDGGAGDGGTTAPATPVSAINSIRGGCAGSPGDNAAVGAFTGNGGSGGGVFYVIGRNTVSLTGGVQLVAAGLGGQGGTTGSSGGGGGGGAGGLIAIDTNGLTAAQGVQSCAQGGGGGGGGAKSGTSGDGSRGSNGCSMFPAGGGGGASGGGLGGDGATGGGDGGSGGNETMATSGGGGGGGGAGWILAFGTGTGVILGAGASPPVQ